MLSKKYIILFSICIAFAFILGFLVSKLFFNASQPERTMIFYASVIENHENSLLVAGIPENDINHRGQFFVSFAHENSTNVLDMNNRQINLSDIPDGSLILIEYKGGVMETYPGQIHGAVFIQILE